MRPEVATSAQLKVESAQEEYLQLELTDDDELVLNLLKDNSLMDLNALRGQTDTGLFVTLV